VATPCLQSVACLEIWKGGGAAKMFDDLFFKTDTNVHKILIEKFLTTFFSSNFSLLSSFHIIPMRPT
jgi:hypothetical protein